VGLCVFVAIETCRQQLSGTTTENNLHGQSERLEQMASNKVPPPMFEEFFVGSVNELVFEVPGFFFFFF